MAHTTNNRHTDNWWLEDIAGSLSGGIGGGTQYQELATTSSATGTLTLGRYKTSLPTLTNGQMNEPMLDSSSRLLVNIASSSVANQSTNLTQVAGSAIALGQTTASASLPVVISSDQNTVTAVGNAASGATDSGNPVKVGGRYNSTPPTLTNGQRGDLQLDVSGNLKGILTDGTNTANVVAGDTGFNGVATTSGTKTYTFTTSTPGAQTILANTPCSGYAWVEVVYSSVGSGLALTGQFSTMSGGTFVNSSGFSSTPTNTAASALGVAVNTLYVGPTRGTFFQIAVSALTSGTFTGTVTFMAYAPPLSTLSVSQSGTWSVGSSSATGSATPANAFLMGGSDGTNLQAVNINLMTADALSTSTLAMASRAVGYAYNGASLDRLRSNATSPVIAAGATGSNAGVSVTTYNAAKAVIVVNISAFTSGSLTVTINGVTSSGYTYPLLTSTALAAVAVTPLRIFPGATASANAVANDMIPRTIQVVTTVSGTLTYGIDYELSV